MSQSPITRRRFLASSLAAVAAGAIGAVAWLTRSSGDDPLAATTTSTTPTTVAPTTTAASSPPAPPPTAEPTTTTTTEGQPAASIDVVCRESWGALVASGEFTAHTIDQITVHHTAVVLDSNTDAPSRARHHQQYHQSLGWPDLAYHYLIDRNGHIYEGRSVAYVGDTATDYDPTGHFLVCCEGDFNQQEIGEEQYRSLVQLVAWGAKEFEIDPATVRGHRDLASTSCPGDNLYAMVADETLAKDVAVAIAGSELQMHEVCGVEGASLVAAIEDGSV